jgi:hypothetical protein
MVDVHCISHGVSLLPDTWPAAIIKHLDIRDNKVRKYLYVRTEEI